MRHVEKLKLKAGGWSLEVGRVGDMAGMVAMVCMMQMGVRVAIPLVTCTHSVGSGGEAESFGTEWEAARTVA